MAIRHITRIIRPDTSAAFWHFSDNQKKYIQNTYINTGKIQTVETINSDDMLTRTRITIFGSVEALDAFQNDPNLKPLFEERRAYNKEHNHTFEKEVKLT